MDVRPNEYPILEPFRQTTPASGIKNKSTRRGITARRSFGLALTRSVIDRAISNIVSKGSWDPRPKKLPNGFAGKTPRRSALSPGDGRTGRPRVHKLVDDLGGGSKRCGVCTKRETLANKKRSKSAKLNQTEYRKSIQWGKGGCHGCRITICSGCIATYTCPA